MDALHRFGMAQQLEMAMGFAPAIPPSYHSEANKEISCLVAVHPAAELSPKNPSPLLALISHVPFPGCSVF